MGWTSTDDLLLELIVSLQPSRYHNALVTTSTTFLISESNIVDGKLASLSFISWHSLSLAIKKYVFNKLSYMDIIIHFLLSKIHLLCLLTCLQGLCPKAILLILCGIINVCKINIGITAIAKVETEIITSIKRAI